MTTDSATNVKEEIVQSLKKSFDLNVLTVKQIERGFRNLKWRMETDRGVLFVKQYSPRRYPAERVAEIETTLDHQLFLFDKGVPCPGLLKDDIGSALLTAGSHSFVVMSFCRGTIVLPGKATKTQMNDLGKVTGRMHMLLNEHAFPQSSLHWQPESRDEMLVKWEVTWQLAREHHADWLLPALQKQKQLIQNIDLSAFEDCETGWMHWDLWADNILFEGERVSAILDFDRMKFLFPELDAARAVMSFALDEGQLDLEKTRSFLTGYREYRIFPKGKIVTSLKLLWCLESFWWFRPEIQNKDQVPYRFYQEMLWLTDHWTELERILGDI